MVVVPETSKVQVRFGRITRRVKLVGLLAGVALIAAACGSSAASNGTTSSSGAGATSTPAAAASTLSVKSATVGAATALVDSKGLTLYVYALDKPGKIACISTACVSSWPPLLLPSGDQLASMSGLGTEKRPNGDVQVTYHGSPLYTFSGDSKAGQDNGAGIPDWSVAKVASSTEGASSSTTTTTSAGGYGY
jgi:predicted lipoprotein with Yx(FWY)xxD motif